MRLENTVARLKAAEDARVKLQKEAAELRQAHEALRAEHQHTLDQLRRAAKHRGPEDERLIADAVSR
jgi:hypothetical protein